MTILTTAYNFHFFLTEPIFIDFVGGRSGGAKSLRKFWSFFMLFFKFFEGVRGRSPQRFLEISRFSDAVGLLKIFSDFFLTF